MVKGGRAVTMRVPDHRMQLHVPVDRLARFAERQRLGNLHTNQGEARCELINNSDVAILSGYNALMRGFAEYYKLGTLWKREVSRLHHLWWWSFMKTLSRKHKCSVRKTAERLRNGKSPWPVVSRPPRAALHADVPPSGCPPCADSRARRSSATGDHALRRSKGTCRSATRSCMSVLRCRERAPGGASCSENERHAGDHFVDPGQGGANAEARRALP